MLAIYNKSLKLGELMTRINPFKFTWDNIDDTNCYMYALGLDLAREEVYPFEGYNPGVFSACDLGIPFSEEQLIHNLESDLAILELDYKEVDPDYVLKNQEWKIAVMAESDFSLTGFDDYHFLRESKNGIWMHKKGFRCDPTNLDSRGKIIKSPTESVIETDGFFSSSRYRYLKTLCLKKG